MEALLNNEDPLRAFLRSIYSFFCVLSGIISNHSLPYLTSTTIFKILYRLLPAVEFGVHYVAIHCEP